MGIFIFWPMLWGYACIDLAFAVLNPFAPAHPEPTKLQSVPIDPKSITEFFRKNGPQITAAINRAVKK